MLRRRTSYKVPINVTLIKGNDKSMLKSNPVEYRLRYFAVKAHLVKYHVKERGSLNKCSKREGGA